MFFPNLWDYFLLYLQLLCAQHYVVRNQMGCADKQVWYSLRNLKMKSKTINCVTLLKIISQAQTVIVVTPMFITMKHLKIGGHFLTVGCQGVYKVAILQSHWTIYDWRAYILPVFV